MKDVVSFTEHWTITTKQRYEILDITDRVEEVRKKAKLAEGFVLVSTMHVPALRLRQKTVRRGDGPTCKTISDHG